MSENINELILEKINESDDPDWVKDFVKRILSFERTQYTGAGGQYKDFYADTALELYEGSKDED